MAARAAKKAEIPVIEENAREIKAKKIKKQLLSRFRGADGNTKRTAEKLAERAAFMAVTLDELEQDIAENGAIITAINGNGFEIKQENPAQKSYNATIKNYNSTIMSLDKLAKESGAGQQADPLLEFIQNHK